ncbi:hypothetical protein [Butyrivibrio sp. INlla21]|uniref:hypothetical protein n=1 Tax=Butyrivibrio sp. INlla21 TaxID=1520811 RepID=UPI0008EEB793|nr:hypothetical protein [Butyrivibrio sp. INlla21]SFV01852.1 hypothetical protein SAMN02910342_02996 [Butyrivibrio sp. INlla21]
MDFIKRKFYWMYYSGGIELIIAVVMVVISAVLSFTKYEKVAKMLALIVLAICVAVLIAMIVSKSSRKSTVFTLRRTIGGYIVNQSANKYGECFAEEFPKDIKRGIAELPAGIYKCYTHDIVVNRIKREEKDNGRVQLIDKVRIDRSKLKKEKENIRKTKTCIDCKRNIKCPFFIDSDSVQMYGIKFRIVD